MPDPEISNPVSLDEIHEVLADAEMAAEKHRWEPLAALSLYVIALVMVRLLEVKESRE